MKNIILWCALVIMSGCAYEGDQITSLIKDPQFVAYEERLNELDSSYLQKKISYSEYHQKKKELEESYNRQVQQRNERISPKQ